jgi:branched-chain amino acid transport system ATP-binding protein
MTDHLLEVRGVSCTLGGVRAVDDVSVGIAEGSISGVLGPNGAGKTTLFNTITRFARIDRGEVLWDGTPIQRWRPSKVANSGLTRTFQNAGGFGDMTVRENLALAGRRNESADIDWISALLGLGPDLDRRVESCSLATRKLVGIAMAMVRRPRMLLLDEPLAGLDLEDRDSVVESIRLVHQQGVTILLIEHDVDRVLALADQIIILDVGAKVADGAPHELMGMPELRDVYMKA